LDQNSSLEMTSKPTDRTSANKWLPSPHGTTGQGSKVRGSIWTFAGLPAFGVRDYFLATPSPHRTRRRGAPRDATTPISKAVILCSRAIADQPWPERSPHPLVPLPWLVITRNFGASSLKRNIVNLKGCQKLAGWSTHGDPRDRFPIDQHPGGVPESAETKYLDA
jgi:hypothetical protein